jgi:hypothetical protein
MLLSRKIGSSVPSAVVVSPSATGTNARTKPAYASSPTSRPASAAEATQAMTASLPARCRKSASSSS